MTMNLASILPPLLGQFTGLYLFFNPLREIGEQRKKGVVNTDCLPFVVTLVQQILWIIFAGMLHDLWIFVPNMLGTLGIVFYITSALRYQTDESMLFRMEILMSVGISLSMVFAMFAMTPLFVESVELRKSICGSICLVINVAMYAAPCLEAMRAIMVNDSSRLSKRLAFAGALNGGLWAIYGLAVGNIAVMIPNALGFVLSFLNLLIKLCVSSKIVEHESVEGILQKATSEGRLVRISSLAHDTQPNVQKLPVEKEDALSKMQVFSAAVGVAMHVFPMPSGHVAFRLPDGRFLCVSARSEGAPGSKYQPSTLTVVAKFVEKPGPENEFQVLSSSGVGLHRDEQKMCVYGSDTVSFWNPLHQVFLRLNELGDFDCSPQLVPGAGKLRLPGGWYWERFSLTVADVTEAPAV